MATSSKETSSAKADKSPQQTSAPELTLSERLRKRAIENMQKEAEIQKTLDDQKQQRHIIKPKFKLKRSETKEARLARRELKKAHKKKQK